jgi:hypothetical protein
MALDFSKLLQKPAAEAKKPPVLPPGTYTGVIKKWSPGESSTKKTPFIRFDIGLTDWPDDVEEQDKEGIDLSTRSTRVEFYLTDDATYRLSEFIASLGIDLTDSSGNNLSFGELLPQTIGQPVIVDMVQQINAQTSDIYATCNKAAGLSN